MLVPCQTNVIIIVLFSNVGAYVTTIVLFSAPTCVHTFAPMLILLSYLKHHSKYDFQHHFEYHCLNFKECHYDCPIFNTVNISVQFSPTNINIVNIIVQT